MKRFFWWILLFFVLLVAIPVLAYVNQLLLAKVTGIITVVMLSIALWVWKKQSAQLHGTKNRVKLNLNDRFWLNQNCPFYAALSKEDKIVFTDRMGLFLGNTLIQKDQNLQLTKEDYFIVAASYVMSKWNSSFSLMSLPREIQLLKSAEKKQLFRSDDSVIVTLEEVGSHFRSLPSPTVIENNFWLT